MRHVLFTHRYKIIFGLPVVVLLASTLGFTLSGKAPLVLSPEERFLSVGATTSVTVALDADVPVNVVGGSVILPDGLSLVSLDTSRSLVDLWAQEPSAQSSKIISFGGGMIGGFQGSGEVFSLVVRADKEGTAELLLADPQLLAHDGKGTNLVTASEPLVLEIRRPDAPSPDVDEDNRITILDIGKVSRALFGPYDPRYDLNTDGRISLADVFALLRRLSFY